MANQLPPSTTTGTPLSGSDAVFIAAERDSNLMTVAALYTFAEKMEVDKVKSQIKHYIDRDDLKRARQCVFLSKTLFQRPLWIDCLNYSFDNHFSVLELTSDDREAELKTLISKIHTKPLWEAIWISGMENDKSGMLLRAHHSISDGQGFVRGLLAYVASIDTTIDIKTLQYSAGREVKKDDSGIKEITAEEDSRAARSKKYVNTLFSKILLLIIMVAYFLYGTYLALVNFIKLCMFFRKSMTRKERNNHKQVGWSSKVSLNSVKIIKNHYKISVNDVLVGALSAGLESFLLSRKGLKDNAFWFFIPTSLRRHDDWSVTNQSAGYFLKLPINGLNHAERLKSTNKQMKILKRSTEPIWITLREYSFGSKIHAVVTNVPGPNQPIQWAGKPIDNVIAFIPQPFPNALGCAIYTYNGKVTISVMTDKDEDLESVFAEGAAQDIADKFDQYFEQMLKLVEVDMEGIDRGVMKKEEVHLKKE